ncbi:MAG: Mfa1 family fimbria major subunit [Candidatus Amulumruptor caecigallinarius]|nr:Mfa1 family fimbria major subunit [Candidatus Amulumruptor caecigallinarius]
MKQIAKYALGAAALMMGACSSDEPSNSNNGTESKGGDFYATLTLSLPTGGGTRAENSDVAGEEYGQDNENYVGKVLIVLAEKDEQGRFHTVTYAESDARPGTAVSGTNQISYTLSFDSKALKDDPLSGGSTIPGKQNLYVFAYCNPTNQILTTFSGNEDFPLGGTMGSISSGDNADIWTPNSFLMTNSEISEPVNMPSRDELVNNHNTPQTAVNLGTVKVVRAAARFDFQTTNDNRYDIKDIDGKTSVGTVELTQMAMFNIAKNYFHLPRTSSTWDWTTCNRTGALNYELCGNLEGFVMSPNENNFKSKSNLDAATLNGKYFCSILNNNLTGTSGTDGKALKWTSIKPFDWNNRTDDNHNTWNGADGTNYKIWRYTTENTIPGSTGNQKVGITTGVVFKGEFTPANREVWNGNVIYVYNNTVYGDFNALKAYVDKNPSSVVAQAFNDLDAFKSESVSDLSKNLLKGIKAADCNGFTAYEPEATGMGANAKYVMYYFYYNRHHNNGNNNLMGPNEFGVVRNNVYKLSVTKVGALGSPTSPDDPDTPDEEESAYFTVNCLVMPWTVRVNNIEF